MALLRRCAACHEELDSSALDSQRFCSDRCRYRAHARKRRGQPEADPLTETAANELRAELRKRDRQLVGKERVISRLRATRDETRQQARAAQARAAGETRRAERAIAAAGTEQLQTREDNTALRQELVALRQQVAEAAAAAQELDRLRAAVAERSAGNEQAAVIRRQWEALAVRIARQAAGVSLPPGGLDAEVLNTFRKFKKPPRKNTGRQPAATRRRRPAARPAARAAIAPTVERTQR